MSPVEKKNILLDTSEEGYVCEDMCSFEEPQKAQEGYSEKSDLFKAIGVGAALTVAAGVLQHDWVASHEALALSAVFAMGYVGIVLEEKVAFNKSGVALLMAVALWTIRSLAMPGDAIHGVLEEKLGEVAEIVFFLIGAMTIVETVDAHQGFKIITDSISTRSKTTLLWLIGTITFFMSAVLDNLTSTIVMVSLLRKLIRDPETRKFFGAVVVLAANAGGAWTPIGDVTTTMLWINGQIGTTATIRDLFLPSLVSLAVPLAFISAAAPEVRGDLPPQPAPAAAAEMAPRARLVFAAGLSSLLFVPAFKQLTGLPPYLGMLAGLGALWLLTDAIHFGEDDSRANLKVPSALQRIDSQGVLFFLGILMSVASLESSGVLKDLAVWLNNHVPSEEIIAGAIGLVSAVIDNVPLVAATMGMYDLAQHPQDSSLWQLIAYCAGTGGSILIIGSAAGVAYMGLEKADFFWYARKISPWALAGYLGGMGVYLAERTLPVFAPLAHVAGQLPAPLP